MADQDEIDDWLDSDSDDDTGGEGVAPGTPNDSFVADLMTPGTTPEALRKTQNIIIWAQRERSSAG